MTSRVEQMKKIQGEALELFVKFSLSGEFNKVLIPSSLKGARYTAIYPEKRRLR